MSDEIKNLIKDQGEAFDAFKKTVEEVKANGDTVAREKLEKIEKSLDDAIEAKTALEAKQKSDQDAMKKEIEDLELRLSRKGGGGSSDTEAERKAFNVLLDRSAQLDEAGYDGYKSAFGRALRMNPAALSADEQKAMSVGTDSEGGYLVPTDTSGRIVKKVFETSNIRQIASVQQIGTDKLEGIEDLEEAAAGWVGETSSRTDTANPGVGKYSIEAFEMYAQPKITQKLLDDASVDVEAWLADKVSDKMSRVENDAFVNGNGVGKPKGFANYATAADTGSGVTWGKIGVTNSGASAAFASSDSADAIFTLMGLLKDAYLPGARFVTRRSVITAMRKFKSDDGHYLWQPSLVAGNPETFAGYPISRAEDIPTLAANSLSLWFGNFATAYQIVDRTGIRVLRDPFTDKPYVKFYTTKRTGGGVVNFEAIKAMKFNT